MEGGGDIGGGGGWGVKLFSANYKIVQGCRVGQTRYPHNIEINIG